MADVVPLNNVTKLDIPVERVLDGAVDLERVVLVGWNKEGELHFASSFSDGGEVLWMFELAKKRLLEIAEEMSDG